MATRATTDKRRAMSQDVLGPQPLHPPSPATPWASPQRASAPTSRLKKRGSYGSPSEHSRDAIRTAQPNPDKIVKKEASNGSVRDILKLEPYPIRGRKSLTLEPKALENLNPFQPRSRSTMSSLKTGSLNNTSRPGSPSVSYSNGSTAPILPTYGEPRPQTLPRNKLVKRSSSQRVLNGGSNLHSALRRPATSHQRSATLRRPNSDGEEPIYQDFHPSPLPYDLPEQRQSSDDFGQGWRPFFKPHALRSKKGDSARKRSLHGGFGRHDSPPTIVPDITELPTLLLATSISPRSSDEVSTGRPSNTSALSRPFTPIGLNNFDTSIPNAKLAEHTSSYDTRPRTSLSVSEIFPSPSPLSWKMPRVGSLRKKRTFGRNRGGRRVASAPQPAKAPVFTASGQEDSALGNHTHIYASSHNDETPSKPRLAQDSLFQRTPSSPLPSLDRFSAFEVDLPNTVPAYSTSPQAKEPASPSQNLSMPSSPTSSAFGIALQRNQARYPSGTHSDHASTLLGFDETSRIFSGDGDDTDGRSETLYDSARTGATGSSLSRNKRPHIDTIFDESPPELSPADRLFVSDTLRSSDLGTADNVEKPHVLDQCEFSVDEEPRLSCEEQEHATSIQKPDANSNLQETESSPCAVSTDPGIAGGTISQLTDIEVGETCRSEEMQKQPHSSIPSDEPTVGSIDALAAERQSRSRKSTPRRRESPPSNPFEWSEQSIIDKDSPQGDSPRPKTIHGRQGKELRGSRLNGRRGPPALHLRSQSVPVPNENRSHSNTSKLDSWVLGNKGPSEDWDGDFDFEESPQTPKPVNDGMRPSFSSGMLVPRAILDRQASVHGQFGQVKELTKLVEELKRLQQQARLQGIMNGQAAELWREAEGIINLATLDGEDQELFPSNSPIADFDFFEEDSLANRRRRSSFTPPNDDRSSTAGDHLSTPSTRQSYDRSNSETPPSTARPRKESSARVKSVLENIHQQRTHYDPALLDAKITQKKLPFDTTSLKDLVTRAGVVTRALKTEVRRAENRSESPATTPDRRLGTPPDPPFSQMFQKPPPSPAIGKKSRDSKSPRVTQSPKSPKSPRGSVLGGSIAGNDNDINGHMKMMTVV